MEFKAVDGVIRSLEMGHLLPCCQVENPHNPVLPSCILGPLIVQILSVYMLSRNGAPYREATLMAHCGINQTKKPSEDADKSITIGENPYQVCNKSCD